MRRDDGAISGVLFTLLDVTELAEAERETQRLRGVVQALDHRSSFEAAVRRFDADLGAMLESIGAGSFDEMNARRTLHTAKGDFGQFKLHELATLIHRVEEARLLGAGEIQSVRSLLRATLEANSSVWKIYLHAVDPTHTITESDLRALEEEFASARTIEEARTLFARICDRVRQRSIREILGPLEESCRDHAARSGKRVQVVASGLEIRAPVRLERALGTIGHLTRNAVDHALELPAERGEKAELGTIGFNAKRERDALVIEISDDGRGIDAARVTARALACGALSQERASHLTLEEAIALIFLDGVSTTESASETSGRGVGLAAVKKAIVDAGGTILVETVRGRGTRFVLRFPTTPAETIRVDGAPDRCG
jgi:chemotaxis protein histidine kinase CheA